MKVKVIKCRNEIQTEDNLGLSHVLEQYLGRYTKENTKNTSLCTKNKKSVNTHNTKMDGYYLTFRLL